MDELNKLTEQLEYIFLKKIIEGLKDNSLSISQAKEKAQLFLNLQPFTTSEDVKLKIQKFTSENVSFADLTDLVNSFHIEQKTDRVIEEMKDLIKTDRLDEAIEVAAKTR